MINVSLLLQALSHDRATMFKKGICNFHILDLNEWNNFLVLQSFASILIWLVVSEYLMSRNQYIERKIIHFSLQISDVSSIKTENFVFWNLLATFSLSTGYKTLEIIFLHFVRPMLIFFNTLGSCFTCWKNLKFLVQFDDVCFLQLKRHIVFSLLFYVLQTAKGNRLSCLYLYSLFLFYFFRQVIYITGYIYDLDSAWR